jgi:hypothetical protein
VLAGTSGPVYGTRQRLGHSRTAAAAAAAATKYNSLLASNDTSKMLHQQWSQDLGLPHN